MVVTQHREEAKLFSNELFKSYMRRGDWTVRTLADEVDFRLRRTHKKRRRHDDTAPDGCKRGTIGNLRSGYRSTAHPDTAEAICEIFGIPVEGLFLVSNFKVQREVRAQKAAV